MRVSQTFKPLVRQIYPEDPSRSPRWESACLMCNWHATHTNWDRAYKFALIHADTKLHQTRRDVRMRTRVAVQALFDRKD